MPPGSTSREVTLIGLPDAIATARHEIALLVQNAENPGSVPAAQLVSHLGRREDRTMTMEVPHQVRRSRYIRFYWVILTQMCHI